MKKKFLFVFFILFIKVFSQKDSNIYDFFGGKSFDNKTVFFRLVFQINNNKVNGYMYTDEQGSSETKSLIEGTFNSKTKKIFFNETRKLLSKKKQNLNDLCYLKGTVSLDLKPKISKLKGVFLEQNNLSKICSNGKINLISADAFEKLEQQLNTKKSSKIKIITKKDTLKTKTIVIPNFNSDKKTTIKDDDELVIYWKSNNLKIELWDAMKEDGDKISVTLNDDLILDNYELKNKHKKLEIELKKEENTLTFIANNTGYIANNTARVDLFDNQLKHQIITQLQLNKSVNVIIKKEE